MTKPEALEMTLDELRGIYNMSVESMRRCLVERGFTAFRGIKIYQDDGYLQSFCFKREALKENETFCLPRAEMSRLFKEDQYIRSLILDGSYVYVDGHLVLRDPEYVSFRDLVTPELTPKALSNADECFMVFSVTKPQGPSVKFEDSLNRTPKKMEATYKALRDPKAKPKERAEARQKWNEYIKEWRACMRMTFGETFKAMMKYKEKPAHFFEGFGLSEDQVYNLYKNENRPNIQSVVVIGGRLNMPYEIFIPFVEKAGFDPYSTLKGMPAYLDFMDDANLFKDISEFNDMLVENGYTSLLKPTKAK